MAATTSTSPFIGAGTPGVSKIDPVTIPGFGPAAQSEFDPTKFKVRWIKIDFDDVSSLAELEILETKALRNEGTYILSKDKFVFMDKYFMIVSYLEQEHNANAGR
jgi:hypothetical protein